ncbi:MAG: helix-turn-helix domain-containing protein [Candidatus Izimaplasma sp.]|nr:helix-turn-helix domain-containing protein [Candidatus Izimaplasma bacterium]
MSEIGKHIQSLRQEKQMTQDKLAQKVGVSRQAISKWERGDGLPDLYNIQALSNALDVSVDTLLNQEPKENTRSSQSNAYDNQSFSRSNLSGNFFKQLLYKAKHTTNSAEAKRIKKILLLVGGIGIIVGLSMTIFGFIGFGKGAFDSVNNFHNNTITQFPSDSDTLFGNGTITSPDPFNPFPYIVVFLLGGVVTGLSSYVLYAGLAIVVTSVASNYLDTRIKCPTCGDEVDEDEKVCSSCGTSLDGVKEKVCACGKVNKPDDVYCRKCGKPLTA